MVSAYEQTTTGEHDQKPTRAGFGTAGRHGARGPDDARRTASGGRLRRQVWRLAEGPAARPTAPQGVLMRRLHGSAHIPIRPEKYLLTA